MAERWWMLLKARLFMGVKVFAVLLTALCAGVSLAGCGRVDSAQPDSAHSDFVRSDSDYAELGDEKMQRKDLKKALGEAARQYLEENQKSYESREQVEVLSAGKKGGEDGSDSSAIIVSRVSMIKAQESFAMSSKKRARSKRIWFSTRRMDIIIFRLWRKVPFGIECHQRMWG